MYPFQSHHSGDSRSHLIENVTFDLNMAKSNVRHLILIENSTSDLNNMAKSISVQSALHYISSIFRAIPVERQDKCWESWSAVQHNKCIVVHSGMTRLL